MMRHDEVKTEVKKSLNFQSKNTSFFAALKPKEKKGDEIVATEWEKVDLNDAKAVETKNEDEKKDEEKEVAEADETKPTKITGRFSSFFAKFKRAEIKAEVEEKDEPEEEKLTDEASEELKELEPEDKEEKIEDEKQKRIGSETPV